MIVHLEIFFILIQTGGRGGIRVGDIQKMGHISRSAVSHHLKIMLDAGIISRRREGTKNYYYIDFRSTTVKPVIEFWQQAEPMLMLCNKISKESMKQSVSYSIYFSPTRETK